MHESVIVSTELPDAAFTRECVSIHLWVTLAVEMSTYAGSSMSWVLLEAVEDVSGVAWSWGTPLLLSEMTVHAGRHFFSQSYI